MLTNDSKRLRRRFASGAAGAGAVAVLLSARVAFADPVVSVTVPAAAAVVGDSLPVSAKVTSVYLLSTVHAQAGAAGVDLACVNSTCTGTLDLSALPTGPLDIVVTATDVTAAVGTATVSVTHDHAPTIAVQTAVGAVARPTLRLRATCSDGDAYGCAAISVTASSPQTPDAVVASVNAASLDQVVSFAAYNNKIVSLLFKTTDAAGLTATKSFDIYVDTSPYFQEVAKGDGPIVDVDATRILFTGASSLVIRPWAGGADTPVAGTGSIGFLTQLGAIWPGGEMHNGTTEANNAKFLVANASYAAWSSAVDGPGWYRDIVGGVTTQITPGNYVYPNSVAANGDAIYTIIDGSLRSVFRYRAGVLTKIPPDSNSYGDGVTDGTYVVYSSYYDYIPGLWLDGDGPRVQLVTSSKCGHPSYHYDPRIVNGWVAFLDYQSDCSTSLYTRSPAGVIALASPFAGYNVMHGLAEDGEVIFSTSNVFGATYRGRAGSLPTKIDDNGLGRFFRINAKWYRTIGASLFELVTPGAADAGVDAASDASSPDGSTSSGSGGSTSGASTSSGSASGGSTSGGSASDGGDSSGGDSGGGASCDLTGRAGSSVPMALGLLFAVTALLRRGRKR